jgi:hypothetical protein
MLVTVVPVAPTPATPELTADSQNLFRKIEDLFLSQL